MALIGLGAMNSRPSDSGIQPGVSHRKHARRSREFPTGETTLLANTVSIAMRFTGKDYNDWFSKPNE